MPPPPAAHCSRTTPDRPVRRLATLLMSAVVAVSACGIGRGDGPSEAAEPTTTTPDATVAPTTANSTTTIPPATTATAPASSPTTDTNPENPAAFRCGPLERQEAGEVERLELVETSGLASSRHHDGVLWATNDSGQRSGVYAIDGAGGDLGFFALTDGGTEIDTVDVEDLAIADDILYLADIGDNATRRDTVSIYLLAEPTPGADGSATVLDTVELRYPDGPTDAEALIVDPVTAELIILSKDLDDPSALTRLYSAPLEAAGGQVLTASAVGTIDVAALTATSDGFSFNTLLFPGSVTGADLSPGGDLIAIRTYGSVWLYPRRPGQSVAEALTSNEPCEVGAAPEAQGETVAFLTGPLGSGTDPSSATVGLATISEGGNPPINVTTVQVSG